MPNDLKTIISEITEIKDGYLKEAESARRALRQERGYGRDANEQMMGQYGEEAHLCSTFASVLIGLQKKLEAINPTAEANHET